MATSEGFAGSVGEVLRWHEMAAENQPCKHACQNLQNHVKAAMDWKTKPTTGFTSWKTKLCMFVENKKPPCMLRENKKCENETRCNKSRTCFQKTNTRFDKATVNKHASDMSGIKDCMSTANRWLNTRRLRKLSFHCNAMRSQNSRCTSLCLQNANTYVVIDLPNMGSSYVHLSILWASAACMQSHKDGEHLPCKNHPSSDRSESLQYFRPLGRPGMIQASFPSLCSAAIPPPCKLQFFFRRLLDEECTASHQNVNADIDIELAVVQPHCVWMLALRIRWRHCSRRHAKQGISIPQLSFWKLCGLRRSGSLAKHRCSRRSWGLVVA